MTTYELCKQQMDELKQKYVMDQNESASYEELANAVDIPDDVIHEHFALYVFTDDDFWCTARKTKLEYYVDCFERDLVLYINPEDEAKVWSILDKAYDYWNLGEDEVSCVCCEKYMCDCLKEIGIDFLWAEYREDEEDV